MTDWIGAEVGKFDDLKRLRASAAQSIKDGDSLSKAVETTRKVAESAASEAKITNRNGELSKWRVAKAAARPTKTGRRLLKGAVAGATQASSPNSEADGPPSMSGTPASWYPDPHGRFEYRYWDGESWTADVATNGESSIDRPWVPATDSSADVKVDGAASAFERESDVVSKRSPGTQPRPLVELTTDIYGAPQSAPEGPGERRLRLLGACHHAIAESELGRALFDVLTQSRLAEARGLIFPVFDREPSMIEPIATRGAFGYLQANRESLRMFALSVGWELDDSTDTPEWKVANGPEQGSASAYAQEGAFTAEICAVASHDRKLSAAPMEVWRSLPFLARMSQSNYLDIIAWTVVAASRTEAAGQVENVWANVGVPSALSQAGWYPDPIYEKGYRYHDGRDWTLDCWMLEGDGRAVEMRRALRMDDPE